MDSHDCITQSDERACKKSNMSADYTMAEAAPAEEREFETKRQLAARLGVSVRTIDNLLARGLPHVKLTQKLTRFPRIPVNEWLAEREIRRR
jgi:predicted DNA-binding transcriptional regulator AlpA